MRIAALLALSLMACVDEADVGESQSSVITNNRLIGNQLAENRLIGNQLAGGKLAGNRLSDGSLAMDSDAAHELASTSDGREVLAFIISCAIDDGITLSVEEGGTTYTFDGALGLASNWLNAPLTRNGKGWVSACLFARVNVASLPIPISLRGNSPKLRSTDDERAAFSLQEGAFFGNFFTPDDEPIDWNACRGSDQAAGEVGGLILRDCTEPDPAHPGLTLCGFKYAGDCGDFAATYACKHYNDKGTFYSHCQGGTAYDKTKGNKHDLPIGNDSDTYQQVITTYVLAPI